MVAIIVAVLIFIFPATFDRFLTYLVAGLIIGYDVFDSTWLAMRRKKFTKICVDDSGIAVIKGGLFRRKEFIPLHRISVVRQYATPPEDWLQQLRISVVSASKDVELPPLSRADGSELIALLEKSTGNAN